MEIGILAQPCIERPTPKRVSSSSHPTRAYQAQQDLLLFINGVF